MNRLFLALALSASSLAAAAQPVPSECRSMLAAIGAPVVRPVHEDDRILCRDGYVLLHSSERKTPYWVVERLSPLRFMGPGDRKAQGDPFATDPDLLAEGLPAATSNDYLGKKSATQRRGFDRGHMAPAADMKFSEEATTQSFYMSNMAPQQGLNLNRHIWANLEALMRTWACDRRDIYVLTGPIYDDEGFDTLGPGDVAVPTAFFKIAFEPRQRRVVAFILPNAAVKKKGKKAEVILDGFRVAVNEIEQRTGMRFFGKLDARTRRQLVSSTAPMWTTVRGCVATDE